MSERRRLADGTLNPDDELVAERYEIIEHIGSGGIGHVYHALDRKLHRRVALKMLRVARHDTHNRDEQRERLVREAQALAQIADPNIVTVYDVGVARDRVFVAMEMVPGQPLNRWLRVEERTSLEILEQFRGVASGLAAAHRVGLVHRDVKPSNVVVGNDGRVRLVDFGLVCAAEGESRRRRTTLPDSALARLTHSGLAMGTPTYISPEQLAGMPVDARTDQFAFCVSLWEALGGSLPFAGETLVDRAIEIDAGRLRGRKRIPRLLRPVLERGLSSMPDDRFPSMGALWLAVEEATLRRCQLDKLALLGGGLVAGLSVGALLSFL